MKSVSGCLILIKQFNITLNASNPGGMSTTEARVVDVDAWRETSAMRGDLGCCCCGSVLVDVDARRGERSSGNMVVAAALCMAALRSNDHDIVVVPPPVVGTNN